VCGTLQRNESRPINVFLKKKKRVANLLNLVWLNTLKSKAITIINTKYEWIFLRKILSVRHALGKEKRREKKKKKVFA